MKSLGELEADAAIRAPRDAGIAIKALKGGYASEDMQKLAYRFIVDELAGTRRLGFSLPDTEAIMGWREGRRFVGLTIEAIADAPMTEESPAEPPARTMTQRAEARNKARG